MCKLMASSVVWFLLFTAAKANATPVRDTAIPNARVTMEPVFTYSVAGLSALPLELSYPEAVRYDSIASARRESALNLLTTDLTGNLRAVYEAPAARWVTTPESVVTSSPALLPIFSFDKDASPPIASADTVTILNGYNAGFLLPVSEPVSLLLLGVSLLAIAGMIRRAIRSAGHSSYEGEDSQLPATFRRLDQSAFRARQ